LAGFDQEDFGSPAEHLAERFPWPTILLAASWLAGS